jgi:hypothetical protein
MASHPAIRIYQPDMNTIAPEFEENANVFVNVSFFATDSASQHDRLPDGCAMSEDNCTPGRDSVLNGSERTARVCHDCRLPTKPPRGPASAFNVLRGFERASIMFDETRGAVTKPEEDFVQVPLKALFATVLLNVSQTMPDQAAAEYAAEQVA